MAATLFLVFEAFRFSWLGRTETSVHPDCNICFTFSVGLAGSVELLHQRGRGRPRYSRSGDRRYRKEGPALSRRTLLT